MKQWAENVLDKIIAKEAATVQRNRGRIPYRSIDGVYEDMAEKRIGWWTNGFWGGILWNMYQLTREDDYMEEARLLEQRLDTVLLDAQEMDHDSGFRWLPTAVLNFRLTGDPKASNRGLLAATHLAGRLNPAGCFLRAWNNRGTEDKRGQAIIDCMMNLPLLCWATRETKDSRFEQIARLHADRTLECFIRPDGSVRHIVCFDPYTGAYQETLGGQGFDAESAWTRGQGWGLYGFVLAYQHLDDVRYLDAAQRIAGYVLSELDESYLIPSDFRQPADCGFEDSIAAAILACGLIELSRCLDQRNDYMQAALHILRALDEKRADYDLATDGILTHCSVRYYEENHDQKIMYGDFFYIEALLKLVGKSACIW